MVISFFWHLSRPAWGLSLLEMNALHVQLLLLRAGNEWICLFPDSLGLWWPLLRLTLKDSMFILYDGFAGALG